ncbi:hypothetical protein JHK86_034983 [Glycine max]|nr:hypothetical protein JHK86_034983 [Glycine max]
MASTLFACPSLCSSSSSIFSTSVKFSLNPNKISLPFAGNKKPLSAPIRRRFNVIAMAPPKPGGKAKKAGKATPAPPVGPALGSKGVNIMAFCKDYNARTADKPGYVIPVEITVYDVDIGVEKGSKDPKAEKVGKVTIDQLRTSAAEKLPDLNCSSIESAMRIIAGTAANMGIVVDPPVLEPKQKEFV